MRWCLYFFVALVMVFLLLPILTVIVASFASSAVMTFPPAGFTTRWYFDIPAEFLDVARVSIIVAAGTAALATIIGIPTALALVRGQIPGKKLIGALCLSPLSVPTLVIAVAAYQFTSVVWRISGATLDGTMLGLILAQSAFAIPFVIRAVIAGHANVDYSLEEASLNLGATPLYTFYHVTVPLLMPGIVSGAIFAFLMSFDDVPVALFLGGGDVTTLPVKIFTSIEFSLDVWIMAVASLIIGPSLILMLAMDRIVGLDRFFGAARG